MEDSTEPFEPEWDDVCAAEPFLGDLAERVATYAEISQASRQRHCLRDLWFNWLAHELQPLVGFRRAYDPSVPAWMVSSSAFDAARYHLQDVAGPCRHEDDC